MVAKDGTRARRWTAPAAETPEGKQATEWRDDGLRRLPQPADPHLPAARSEELDAALSERRIDRAPAVRPARGAHGPAGRRTRAQEAARDGHRRRDRATSTRRATRRSRPQQAAAVAAAGKALGDIWACNVFPRMNITWGTYPQPHRPQDSRRAASAATTRSTRRADGKTISQDCTTCHTLLAQDEKDPEILKTLSP